METVIARLRESSTYQGFALLLGVFGVAVNPVMIQEIGVGVASIIGLIKVVFPQGK